jgi:hypothetical protein
LITNGVEPWIQLPLIVTLFLISSGWVSPMNVFKVYVKSTMWINLRHKPLSWKQ